MSIGLAVSRDMLDMKSAEAVIAVRDAFAKVDTIIEWLKNNPVVLGVDPLTLSTVPVDPTVPSSAPGQFGYSVDEAATVRSLFTSLDNIAIRPILKTGRKLTGLQ